MVGETDFVSGEMRDPRRDLPRGLLIGVIGVIICYVFVSYSCVRVLGVADLARTNVPASEVMRHAFGERGAQVIAAGIAISTLGFLSQSHLRHAGLLRFMTRRRLVLRAAAIIDRRTCANGAIVLQVVRCGNRVAGMTDYQLSSKRRRALSGDWSSY